MDHVLLINSGFSEICAGVIGKTGNYTDYSRDPSDIRRSEKEILRSATGIETAHIIFLNQVHGDRILEIDTPPVNDMTDAGDADALMTSTPGLCLVIRTADCVPVLFYDRKNLAIAAGHSGWRGTEKMICRNIAGRMREKYGTENRDLFVYILPSIGPDSYTVNRDVADLFSMDSVEKNGLIYLDLWQNIERGLKDEGVPSDNIFNTRLCNLENHESFFSHRKGDTGRNLNFIFLTHNS